MILYVDMEHASGRSKPYGERLMAARMRIKYRLEELTGLPCLIVHYSRLSLDVLARYEFKAILLSGSATDPEHYTDLDGFNEVVRKSELPILGLCGGWQFMAQAFGADIQPMGELAPGDLPEEAPVIFRDGYIQEYGFKPVRITESHSLLDGLPEQAVFWHAHYMEVNPVPAGFRVYARSEDCSVQFSAHESLPRFGTQFHPEYYNEEHTAGRVLLKNFFRLAGVRTNDG